MSAVTRAAVVVGVALLSTCADFRAAGEAFCRANPPAKGCAGDVAPDGGGTVDGGGAVDAGAPDAGARPYDGGQPCTNTTRPRLQCQAPLALSTTGGIGQSALAATDDAFVGIVIRPNTNAVEVFQWFLDGGSASQVFTESALVTSVAVAGRGSAWAASWVAGLQTSVACLTSASSTVARVTSDVLVDVVTIDVTATGQVGLAARSSNGDVTPRAGIAATTGCPTSMAEFRDTRLGRVNAAGVGIAALPDGQSFRVTTTGPLNGGSGVISITRQRSTGGFLGIARILPLEALDDVSTAVSGDGNWLLDTYSRELEDGGYGLAIKPLPTSYDENTEINIDSVSLLPFPRTWNMGRCGPGCMAVSMSSARTPVTLSVTFVRDDDTMVGLGQQYYDVACSRSPNATGASVAAIGDVLGVLYSEASKAELYRCDKPPF